MGNFEFIKTPIDDLIVIEPKVFGDDRGYFMETYVEREFFNNGVAVNFVQDNQSRSRKGVLRGLHFQKENPQGKLVRCIEGEVFDVAVDLRKNKKSYGQWYGVILSDENRKQFYVPEGFAHGFLTLSEYATFCYKCTRYYAPSDEGGIMWNDPDIAVKWPIEESMTVMLSEKDKKNPCLRDAKIYF